MRIQGEGGSDLLQQAALPDIIASLHSGRQALAAQRRVVAGRTKGAGILAQERYESGTAMAPVHQPAWERRTLDCHECSVA